MEVVIKDTSIVLTPANIKSYMMQTLRGLEYLHNNWVLHRVSFGCNYIKFTYDEVVDEASSPCFY